MTKDEKIRNEINKADLLILQSRMPEAIVAYRKIIESLLPKPKRVKREPVK